MEMLNLYIKYRPMRIGWCVRSGNFDDLRTAMLLSHVLWGGRFNPIVPVENEALAVALVEAFRVDALYPIRDDPAIKAFVDKRKHVQWPILHRGIVVADDRYPQSRPFATVLDIYHALVRLHDEYVKDLPQPKLSACLYSWEQADPLGNVLLATLGAYPPVSDIRIDYAGMMKKALVAQEVAISSNAAVPSDLFQKIYPSKVTEYLLDKSGHGGWGWTEPGLYVGDSQDYGDVVTYWNLRAADIDLYFYDPTHKMRLDPLKDAWLGRLREWAGKSQGEHSWERRIAVWAKTRDVAIPTDVLAENTARCVADEHIWNGLNVTPPMMHFKERSVLAAVSDDDPPRATFQLPEKPFEDDSEFMNQHVVVSVHPLVDVAGESVTFSPPFIPELNEHYGREFYYAYNEARAEPSGVGIITTVTTDNLTVTALDVRELVQKTFAAFGVDATPSPAGRVTSRLIQQMGGLQGCRVFKIAGVRRLIEEHKPDQSFIRHKAIQLIGHDLRLGRKNYDRYEGLCLEYRPGWTQWTPEDALQYLLKKKVFVAGLEFRCPRCQLGFWCGLDDVRSEVRCEYCAARFDVTTQLKDRNWAFRRSGLFGRDDHQGGGMGVSVVLQQMDTALHRNMLFTTGMELSSNAHQINCETDLVVLHPEGDGRSGVVIGECKTRGNIEESDVVNLARVADALPKNRFDVFLLFAKFVPFSAEEIAVCKKAQDRGEPRVILLSDRELEPYRLYELAEKEYVMRHSYASSLKDMACATVEIYFNRVLKAEASL